MKKKYLVRYGRSRARVVATLFTNTLPSAGLLFKALAPGLIDTIGLSVSDYLLVPEELRDIFYIDPLTRRSDVDTLARIKISPYLNISELVGCSQKVFALYADGTALATLQRACRYAGVVYGTYYGADLDGNTVVGTPDIGAYEYVYA